MWHFRFAEPGHSDVSSRGRAGGGANYAWVLLPSVVDVGSRSASSSVLASSPSSSSPESDTWCTFMLERPRGGNGGVSSDLRAPPPTVPVLLGRAALERRRGNGGDGGDGDADGSGGEWRLTWDQSAYRITRSYSSVVDRESCETIHCRVSRRAFGGSNGGGGGVDDAGRVDQWVVISSKFCPDMPARDAYEDHTKRSYSGLEEVSLLFLLPPG